MQNPTEAGTGDHAVYPIRPASSDTTPLTPNAHYIGIDAVSWFLNKEGSFFRDRTASGAMTITLADGLEAYSVGLGTFELKDGAKTAPVFEDPVLPDRNFRGGAIGITVSLMSFAKDNAIASLLKSTARASLGVVGGLVQTASLAGPQQILAAAGQEMINGAATLLGESASSREPVFAGGGIKTTIRAADLRGPATYFLLHRGQRLNSALLGLGKIGAIQVPTYGGKTMLNDGAWLLVRMRRTHKYQGVRDWFDAERNLRGRIDALLLDVAQSAVTKADALLQLQPNSNGGIFDAYVELRGVISRDGVMSENEARDRIRTLAGQIAAARNVIQPPASVGEKSTARFARTQHSGPTVDDHAFEAVRAPHRISGTTGVNSSFRAEVVKNGPWAIAARPRRRSKSAESR